MAFFCIYMCVFCHFQGSKASRVMKTMITMIITAIEMSMIRFFDQSCCLSLSDSMSLREVKDVFVVALVRMSERSSDMWLLWLWWWWWWWPRLLLPPPPLCDPPVWFGFVSFWNIRFIMVGVDVVAVSCLYILISLLFPFYF